MSGKTIFAIILTALLTVFLTVNNDPVDFNFIVTTIPVSKLLVIGICILIGFILGFMVRKPRKVVKKQETHIEKQVQPTAPTQQPVEVSKTITSEDKDYIS